MSFLVYLAAGFVSGLLGGMGMGGGTVLIPVLTVFCGVAQQAAQVTNLLSFLPMSAFSVAMHKKQGLIRTGGLAALILPAVLTSVGGGLVALFTGDRQALPGRESVRLYRGRATAIVRADGTGRVVLKAEADGLKKGRASVRVKPVKAQS